jgi:hypothetical protein
MQEKEKDQLKTIAKALTDQTFPALEKIKKKIRAKKVAK